MYLRCRTRACNMPTMSTSSKIWRRKWISLILVCVSGIFIATLNTYKTGFTEAIAKMARKEANVSNDHSKDGAYLWNAQYMVQRRETLTQRCKELYAGEEFQHQSDLYLRHFIVSDKHKLIYCFVPKAACSNLKRVFLLLTGHFNNTDPSDFAHGQVHGKLQKKYLPFLVTYNKSEIMYRLERYRKIMFVREPLERLLSAYRNKFGPDGEKMFKTRYGRYIVEHFRKNASQRSLAKGNDVTFTEFVKYLIKTHELRKPFERHWMKYTDLCYPCQVRYDFIGNVDTLDQDMDLLLDGIGVSSSIRFPKREESYTKSQTADVMYKFYKDIKKVDLKRLKGIYENDSFLFDYKFPQVLESLLEDK